MDIEDQIDKTSERISELKEEKKSLKDDLNLIHNAVRAASALSTGDKPKKKDAECLQEITGNYTSFFVDDSEDEGPKDPEDSPSLLVRIMSVKNYLRKEKSINSKILDKLYVKRDGLRKDLFKSYVESQTKSSKSNVTKKDESSKLGTIEKGESSKSGIPEQDKSSISESLDPRVKRIKLGTASDEKGKGPVVESDDKGKGKGPAPDSPSFDDFPNPFDDIGFD